jgi:hypothetical protein
MQRKLPLELQCYSTRTLEVLNCHPECRQGRNITLDGDGTSKEKLNAYKRYKRRLEDARERNPPVPDLREVTSLDCIRLYEHKTLKPRPGAAPRLVYFSPMYRSDPNHDEDEDYYCVKVGRKGRLRCYRNIRFFQNTRVFLVYPSTQLTPSK